ncbi:DUF4905 domain-containing protein [Pedobacter alpinus]|uniref:DUF4905 domain-containing protein n=1 Tax=Pedobacter alpinus TaxID=1590643 RepID=A0ABW5TUN0_9SPHI
MITNKGTLKEAYNAKCDGIIWKIALDEQQELIVWECRTIDKKVSFYAYDFKNQTELLTDFSFEEEWLLSLSQVVSGIAYFNSYESVSSPVQKGIIAFDLKAKKILWQNFSITIHLISKEGVLVYDSKILPRKFQLLNFTNGSFIKNISVDELSNHIAIGNDLLLPKLYEEKEILNVNYVLNFNELTINSFFKQTDGKINQFIKLEKDEGIIFTDIINKDIQKVGFDTFFVWHNLLIYIKNKTEIVSYFV